MNISFSMTQDQVRRSFALPADSPASLEKDVTRRNGWERLQPGQIMDACEKCQGLGKGGKIVKMGRIQVVTVRREPLQRMLDDPAYGRDECRREGFPWLTPAEFCEFFMQGHKGVTLSTLLTRIEFSYLV